MVPAPPPFAESSSPALELALVLDSDTIDVQQAVARVRAREHARRRHDQLAAQIDRALWAERPAPPPYSWSDWAKDVAIGSCLGLAWAMLVVGALL